MFPLYFVYCNTFNLISLSYAMFPNLINFMKWITKQYNSNAFFVLALNKDYQKQHSLEMLQISKFMALMFIA